MTRGMSPGGIPGDDVAAYYRRRAEGGAGLIMTEGTWVPHPSASNQPAVPRFYAEDALAGWQKVVDEVHAAGGRIMPQLSHVGQTINPSSPGGVDVIHRLGPSGMVGALGVALELRDTPATDREIVAVIDAFASAAASAYEMGFDGVELQGAHGLLIDQFFWAKTNLRQDRYGGTAANRTRLAAEIVREIKVRNGADFPVVLRISQFKMQDYGARLFETPADLDAFVRPLNDAGVDAYHCSQRRFWDGEFGAELNLAGWTKRLSGRPTISVGCVTLAGDVHETIMTGTGTMDNLGRLCTMLERGDFDMIASGRALLVDPFWPRKVRAREAITPYSAAALGSLS